MIIVGDFALFHKIHGLAGDKIKRQTQIHVCLCWHRLGQKAFMSQILLVYGNLALPEQANPSVDDGRLFQRYPPLLHILLGSID